MTTSPLLARGPFVTDGGLETDLIFHHGADLPEFAAFPLVEDEGGRALLRKYYDGYADVARKAGQGPAARDADLAGEPRLGGEGRLRPRRAGPGQPARRRVHRRPGHDVHRPRRRAAGRGDRARAVTATSPARRPTPRRRRSTTPTRSGPSPPPAPTWCRR